MEVSPSAIPSEFFSEKFGLAPKERFVRLSEYFLGYRADPDPLGEGADGRYDQDPLFRFDRFDCTTYLETLLALSKSKDPASFEKNILGIRYKNAAPSFAQRNHFPDADWIPHLVQKGWLQDITEEVAKKSKMTLKKATVTIDKEAWYKKFKANRLQLNSVAADKEKLLESLRNEGKGMKKESAAIPYIPFSEIYISYEGGYIPNKSFFNNIPDGTLFNIVRTGPELTEEVGTQLSIWHQGMLIRKEKELYIRHANQYIRHEVHDAQAFDYFLLEYLRKQQINLVDHGLNLLEIEG